MLLAHQLILPVNYKLQRTHEHKQEIPAVSIKHAEHDEKDSCCSASQSYWWSNDGDAYANISSAVRHRDAVLAYSKPSICTTEQKTADNRPAGTYMCGIAHAECEVKCSGEHHKRLSLDTELL